jgi:hypothetical protein
MTTYRETLVTDQNTYTGIDSGCLLATLYIGSQSECLKDCPFTICTQDMTRSQIMLIRWQIIRKCTPTDRKRDINGRYAQKSTT